MQLYFDSRLSGLVYFGEFERDELGFLSWYLRPGDIFLDAGANIGLYTLVAASKVGESGRVFSFEPSSTTYQRLENNVRLNSLTNVSCYKLALSDNKAELCLNVSLDGYDAWNSLRKPLGGNSFTTETVTCITLDEFVNENLLTGHIAMIKVDVEGWEAPLIVGGWQTLSRSDAPLLQLEFNQSPKEGTNPLNLRVSQLLHELGYQLFTFEAKARQFSPFDVRLIRHQTNVIAAKDVSQAKSRLKDTLVI